MLKCYPMKFNTSVAELKTEKRLKRHEKNAFFSIGVDMALALRLTKEGLVLSKVVTRNIVH